MKNFNDKETSNGAVDSQLLMQLHDFAMVERLKPAEVVGMYRSGMIQRVDGLNGASLLFAHGATREQARQTFATLCGGYAQVA